VVILGAELAKRSTWVGALLIALPLDLSDGNVLALPRHA
jgi:hypothetical protein